MARDVTTLLGACLVYTEPTASTQTRLRLQLPTSAVNVTLLAFAAERRAAAPLLHGARRCPSLSPARAARSIDGTDRLTDGRTERRKDARPFHRPRCAKGHKKLVGCR